MCGNQYAAYKTVAEQQNNESREGRRTKGLPGFIQEGLYSSQTGRGRVERVY
jgi:hypothetical protein